MSNGLAFPATAYALIGKPGLYLTVVICFMAVTSCGAGVPLSAPLCTFLYLLPGHAVELKAETKRVLAQL